MSNIFHENSRARQEISWQKRTTNLRAFCFRRLETSAPPLVHHSPRAATRRRGKIRFSKQPRPGYAPSPSSLGLWTSPSAQSAGEARLTPKTYIFCRTYQIRPTCKNRFHYIRFCRDCLRRISYASSMLKQAWLCSRCS